MTHTIRAAELQPGDRYLSTANANRGVTVDTAEPHAEGKIILTVTDDNGMSYRTILNAERLLEAAERIERASIHFSLDANAWVSVDGRQVCQDHATAAPCPYEHGPRRGYEVSEPTA